MVTQATATTASRPADAELVRSTLQGNVHAFDQLVERYFGMICAIGLAHLEDRELTQDLAQEVFLRAYLFLPRLTTPEWFSSWITRMARNLAVDWLRRGGRGSRVATMLPLDESHERTPDMRSPGVRDMLQTEEEAEAVRKALHSLPANERELVLLHFMEDMTQEEIGQRLRVNRSTVSRSLDKALKRMRKVLTPVLRDNLPRMRVPQSAAARTVALVGVAAALNASEKAALCASAATLGLQGAQAPATAAGTGSLLAAIIAIPKSIAAYISSGGAIMGAKGIIAAVAALAVVGGGGYYLTQERAPASTLTGTSLTGQSPAPIDDGPVKRFKAWDDMAQDYLSSHRDNVGLAKLMEAFAGLNPSVVASVSTKPRGQTKSPLDMVVAEGWKSATTQLDAAIRAQVPVLEAGFAAGEAAPFSMPPFMDCQSPVPNFVSQQTLTKMMLATARMSEAAGNADDAARRAMLTLKLSTSFCDENGSLISHLIGMSGQTASAKVLASALSSASLTPGTAAWVLTSLRDVETSSGGVGAAIQSEARSMRRTARFIKNDAAAREQMKPEERKMFDDIRSLPVFEQELDGAYRLLGQNFDKPYWQRERDYRLKLQKLASDPTVKAILSQDIDAAADRAEVTRCWLRLCEALAALRAGNQDAASRIRDPFVDAPLKTTADKIYSVGPDGIDQSGTVIYDPTNGTTSAGDIMALR